MRRILGGITILLSLAYVALLLTRSIDRGDSTPDGGMPTTTPTQTAMPSPIATIDPSTYIFPLFSEDDAYKRAVDFMPTEFALLDNAARLVQHEKFVSWSPAPDAGEVGQGELPREPDHPVWLLAWLMAGATADQILPVGGDPGQAVDGMYIAFDATSGYPIEIGAVTARKFRQLQRIDSEQLTVLTATPFARYQTDFDTPDLTEESAIR